MSKLNTNPGLLSYALMFLGLTLSTFSFGQTIWKGTVNNDYFTAANWTNGLPSADNAGIIPGSGFVEIKDDLTLDYSLTCFGTVRVLAAIHVTEKGALSSSQRLLIGSKINVEGNFENFGDVELFDNATFDLTKTGVVNSSGVFILEGRLTSAGEFSNSGDVDVLSTGTLLNKASGVFENSGTLNISGNYTNNERASTRIQSDGVIHVEAGGSIVNAGEAQISNAGKIIVEKNGLLTQRANFQSAAGKLIVDGKVHIDHEKSNSVFNILTIRSTGMLEVASSNSLQLLNRLDNSGECLIRSVVQVSGILSNRSDGTVDISESGILDFMVATELENQGVFSNAGTIQHFGKLSNSGTFLSEGVLFNQNEGAIVNSGEFINAGEIKNVKQISNTSSFSNRLYISNTFGGVIDNSGVFANEKGAVIDQQYQLYNSATFVNRGIVSNGTSLFNEASAHNYGIFYLVGDVFNNPAGKLINHFSAEVLLAAQSVFTNEGNLENQGKIAIPTCAIFYNSGTVDNQGHLENEGLCFQRGVLLNNSIEGNGLVRFGEEAEEIREHILIPSTAAPVTGISADQLAALLGLNCDVHSYLVDGQEFLFLNFANLEEKLVTLSVEDHQGNHLNLLARLQLVEAGDSDLDFNVGRLQADIPQLTVFPNPANSQVSLSLHGFGNHELRIELIDALGRTVSTRILSGNLQQLTLDVSELSAGWYGITVSAGDIHATQKLNVVRN